MRRVVLGALSALAVMVFPAGAVAGTHFKDPSGDSGTASDITSVDVSNDSAGNVTFAIAFAPPTLASDEGLGLYIDSDQNTSTGNRSGAEYVVFVYPGSWDFYAWNGSSFASVASHGAMTVAPTATGSTITLNTADLGGVSAFKFWINTQRGSGSTLTASDIAGSYTYTLAAFSKIVVGLKPSSATRGIQPGSRFAVGPVRIGLSDGTTVDPDAGSVSCKASVGGTPLPAAVACTWTVPKTARGKTVAVTVGARYGRKPYTVRLSLRVLKK